MQRDAEGIGRESTRANFRQSLREAVQTGYTECEDDDACRFEPTPPQPPSTPPIAPKEAPTSARLVGTVARVVFRSDAGFAVLRVRRDEDGPDTPTTTACGPLGAWEVGDRVSFSGRWETDRRFGRQLRVDQSSRDLPTTDRGLALCLAELVPGVGATLATRLIVGLGGPDQTLAWLDAADDSTQSEPNLGFLGSYEKRVEPLRAEWQRRRDVHAMQAGLASLGLTPGLRARVQHRYGLDALKVCRERPYDLAVDVDGIGFLRADTIALAAGVAKDGIARKTAALLHVMMETAASGGHVFSSQEHARREVEKLISPVAVSSEDVVGAAKVLEARGRVLIGSTGAVGLRKLIEAEEVIADRIVDISCVDLQNRIAGISDLIFKNVMDRLVEEQRQAVISVRSSPFAVVTGGPGVGKTTTTRAICELWKTTLQGSYALCAPTGRAARRLTEATGEVATTIHRLLKIGPGGKFLYDKNSPMPHAAVLVDEASMVDVELMRALVDGMAPSCRLVLVGDADQLPPVGPGAPFRDVCAVNPRGAVAKLTQVHRQAQGSRIVGAAREILAGTMPAASPTGDRSDGALFVLEQKDEDGLLAMVTALVSEGIPTSFGVPSESIQVVAPMRKGKVGVASINARLQAELNKRTVSETFKWKIGDRELEYRVGDRVMQMHNDYKRNLVNGEIGVVLKVHGSKSETVLTVRFPEGDEDKDVLYERGHLAHLDLAYASTVHKVQGAEFPAVIVVCHDAHVYMLDRALLYTAVTRAKRVCFVVGTRKALGKAVKTARSDARRTTLPMKLGKKLGEG